MSRHKCCACFTHNNLPCCNEGHEDWTGAQAVRKGWQSPLLRSVRDHRDGADTEALIAAGPFPFDGTLDQQMRWTRATEQTPPDPHPGPLVTAREPRTAAVEAWERCTCGMGEQERTGHAPQHAEWCEMSDDDSGAAPRILVTGSRDWTDRDAIDLALWRAWHDLGANPETVLVQGECHLGGADLIAKEIWERHGLPVESHPAEMGPDGHVLGPKRNAHMVSLGADLCLAFPLPSSRGTRNCMRLAREAGIPVRVTPPTGSAR